MRIALITETFLPDVNGVVTTLCRLLEYCRDRSHETICLRRTTRQPALPVRRSFHCAVCRCRSTPS
jgi:hypothetical protein